MSDGASQAPQRSDGEIAAGDARATAPLRGLVVLGDAYAASGGR